MQNDWGPGDLLVSATVVILVLGLAIYGAASLVVALAAWLLG